MKLKIICHIIAFIGIAIVIADLKGAFIDKERMRFADVLLKHGVSPHTPGAKQFLSDYLPHDKSENDVRSISVTRIQTSGGTTMSGVVRIVFNNSQEIDACSFQELEKWSKNIGLWIWLGVCVAIIGEFFSVLIIIFENRLGVIV